VAVLLARIDLGLTAIVFVAFGLWGLLAPANMIANVGLAFTNGGGAVAIRGMYGGFLIGAGLLFGISAFRPGMAHFGLIALAVIVGSILASRIFGMVAGYVFPAIQLSYALIEATSFVVTTALLVKGDFG
jgi:Domain of unknown function (DUF4345)